MLVVGKPFATSLSFTGNLQYLLYRLSPQRQPASYKQQIQLEISVQVHNNHTCKSTQLHVHSWSSDTQDYTRMWYTVVSNYASSLLSLVSRYPNPKLQTHS